MFFFFIYDNDIFLVTINYVSDIMGNKTKLFIGRKRKRNNSEHLAKIKAKRYTCFIECVCSYVCGFFTHKPLKLIDIGLCF